MSLSRYQTVLASSDSLGSPIGDEEKADGSIEWLKREAFHARLNPPTALTVVLAALASSPLLTTKSFKLTLALSS
jgi:hypothetical protein